MRDQVTDHLKDWATFALVGLGFTANPHEWLGGMFLGLAGGAFAMTLNPEKGRGELVMVLLGAFIVSHIAALVSIKWFPDVPVALAMVAGGFFSRQVASLSIRLFSRVENRSEEMLDKALGKKGDGK